MNRSFWKGLGFSSVAVIVAATTAPWNNFEIASVNWSRINWMPYSPFGLRISSIKDVVENLLLYIPFGYFLVKGRGDRNRLLLLSVVVWAGALSIATEVAQIFQPRRFPSATDVVNNIIGALLGVGFAGRCGSKENQIDFRSGQSGRTSSEYHVDH